MPTLWFIRHGQATHNVDFKARGETAYLDPVHFDAELTDEGLRQAQIARKKLPDANKEPFTAIYCSPLRRCRKTLMIAAPEQAERCTVYLDDRLMEPEGAHVCNRRLEKSELLQDGAIPANWNMAQVSTENPFDAGVETDVAFTARCRAFTRDLLDRHAAHDCVLVVSHHDMIRLWFREHEKREVSLRNCEVTQTVWPPTEVEAEKVTGLSSMVD